MGGGGRSREQTSDDVVEVVGEEMRGGGRSTGKRVTMWWRWSGKRWGAEGGQGVIMWWRRWSGLFGVEGRNRLDFVFFVTMVSCETTHLVLPQVALNNIFYLCLYAALQRTRRTWSQTEQDRASGPKNCCGGGGSRKLSGGGLAFSAWRCDIWWVPDNVEYWGPPLPVV